MYANVVCVYDYIFKRVGERFLRYDSSLRIRGCYVSLFSVLLERNSVGNGIK